ncbi:lipase family protein [Agarivorans sp. MS3-6]|uniref:lipase family protein n=1 Tax=Agarivorans sp. TSD2052 TaxID=2937286 RepID=UPI00200EAC4E|nr:lipase family protein [Agarivorans sp. TSD2052]UPW19931.1 lipase family protein [Agarivorans sp. TSD2052]
MTLIKPIPDPKSYDIVPPDMGYVYFDAAETHPFEPTNTVFSKVNAWWLADCALLAYTHPGFARMAYKLAGFEQFRFFQGTGTECMAAANEDVLIISFRGTELKSLSALYELRSDLDALPSSFAEGGRVHTGFQKALDEIWQGQAGLAAFIQQQIDLYPNRPMWMTGHSLGGALASLCFAKTKRATGLYIYGAPRVGDKAFNGLIDNRPAWRIEHARDPIPMLPPNLPALKFCFESTGELVYIHSDQTLEYQRPEKSSEQYKQLVLSTFKSQEARRKSLNMDLNEINQHLLESFKEWRDNLKQWQADTSISFTDHMPVYYSLKLWNNLPQQSVNR